MKLNVVPLSPDEIESLVDWLASDTWPFHPHPTPDAEMIRRWIAEGMFTGSNDRAFWILVEGWQKTGLIRLYDLQEPVVNFDLRIWEPYRNRGIGRYAVRWLAGYVFQAMPDKMRIKGVTRDDNLPMRRVLRHCHFVKDAFHLQTWPGEDGIFYDAVVYVMHRHDWERLRHSYET